MKHVVLIFFSLLSLQISAKEKEPKWIEKLPVEENATYLYRCESATDQDATKAQNKAMAKILESTAMSWSVPISLEDVREAIMDGNRIESLAEEYRLSINRVCTFTKKVEGGYRVYVLCQVAKTAAITPEYTTFRDCGTSYSEEDALLPEYPIEWQEFESDNYFASFLHEQYTKGKSETEALGYLQKLAEGELKNKLEIGDGDNFLQYVETKKKFDSTTRLQQVDAWVVVYISKKDLASYFRDVYDTHIGDAERRLHYIQTELLETSKTEAYEEFQNAEWNLKKAETYLKKLNACGKDISALSNNCKRVAEQMQVLKNEISPTSTKQKTQKITNFIDEAVKAQETNRISEALRYYYWANVLLNNLEYPDDVKYNGSQVTIWLPEQIRNLLDNIKVTYKGTSPEIPNIGLLQFTYNNQPIQSLDYRYRGERGWKGQARAKDGIGTIEFSGNEKQKNIELSIEYAFVQEAGIDKEIQSVIENTQIDYSRYARKSIPATYNKPATGNTGILNLPMSVQIDMAGNEVKINKGKYGANLSQLTTDALQTYNIIIDKVCNAIHTHNTIQVKDVFTADGWRLFQRLVTRGNAKILDRSHITYSQLGKSVVARAIKMNFEFHNNIKTFTEDIVFEFNENKKICNVRFMLEKSVIDNIAGKVRWGDVEKLALVDFLENYKTSFALKDTVFLTNVFSDNAMIITGRVVKPQKGGDNYQINAKHIEYTTHTKSSYLKNLSRIFKSNSFVNVSFTELEIAQARKFGDNVYGLRIKQDYASTRYGDSGYLFLLMDFRDYENPIIYVRTWQPEPDTNIGGDGLFGVGHFN